MFSHHATIFFTMIICSYPFTRVFLRETLPPRLLVCASPHLCAFHVPFPCYITNTPPLLNCMGKKAPPRQDCQHLIYIYTVSVISKCSFLQNTSRRQFQEPPSPGML